MEARIDAREIDAPWLPLPERREPENHVRGDPSGDSCLEHDLWPEVKREAPGRPRERASTVAPRRISGSPRAANSAMIASYNGRLPHRIGKPHSRPARVQVAEPLVVDRIEVVRRQADVIEIVGIPAPVDASANRSTPARGWRAMTLDARRT